MVSFLSTKMVYIQVDDGIGIYVAETFTKIQKLGFFGNGMPRFFRAICFILLLSGVLSFEQIKQTEPNNSTENRSTEKPFTLARDKASIQLAEYNAVTCFGAFSNNVCGHSVTTQNAQCGDGKYVYQIFGYSGSSIREASVEPTSLRTTERST